MEYYHISRNAYLLNQQFSSYLSLAVPLSNFKIWLYFVNGQYTLWEVLKDSEKPIKKGKIAPKMKYAKALNDHTIVLYDSINQEITLLDLSDDTQRIYSDTQHFFSSSKESSELPEIQAEQKNISLENNLTSEKGKNEEVSMKTPEKIKKYNKHRDFSALVPSETAISGPHRDDQGKMDEIINNTNILIFPETEAFLVIEKKLQFNNNTTENILTTYQPQTQKEPLSVLQLNTSQRYCCVSPINKKDMVVIWTKQVTKKPISFYTYNIFSQESKQQITLENIYSLTIVDVANFGDNKISFWGNPSQGDGIPLLILYDLESKQESETSLNLYGDQSYLLVEIIEVDMEKQRVVFLKTDEEQCLDILNLNTFSITYSEPTLEQFFATSFSLDNNYFIQYNEEYEDEEDEDMDLSDSEFKDQINLEKRIKRIRVNNITNIKTSMVSILEDKGIIDLYDEYIAKQVVDMLTAPEEYDEELLEGEQQEIELQQQDHFDLQQEEEEQKLENILDSQQQEEINYNQLEQESINENVLITQQEQPQQLVQEEIIQENQQEDKETLDNDLNIQQQTIQQEDQNNNENTKVGQEEQQIEEQNIQTELNQDVDLLQLNENQEENNSINNNENE